MKFRDFWLILFLHLSSCMARGCMENQIQCQNGQGCFEPKQRCDDVKDCEDGFDEEECEPILLITTDRDIRSMPMHSEEYRFIQSDLTQAHGVSIDYKEGSLYWSEKGNHKPGIYKSMLDGSRNQNVISFGVEEIGDLKVDGLGRHLYFVDSGRKNIVVCDLQGKMCAVLCGQLDKPHALAVYPESSMMFWSDWGSRPHIASAGMDGSKRTNIITTGVVWPSGLAVDEAIQRIFWGDTNLNRIESSRIDGSDRKILLNEVNPFSITVFKNMIFWCDPNEHEIISVDKNTGDDYKVMIRNDELTPTSIQIHHPSKQSYIRNPCKNANCSHLCLLSPCVQGFNCACPVGMTLNENNRTCDSTAFDDSSIIIATNTDIYRLNNKQIGMDSIVHLSKDLHLQNIGALVFNPSDNSIIYSDTVGGVIYSMDLNTLREVVLLENADMVEGMDVDPHTESIYFTERIRGTVVIVRKHPNGVRERSILARQLKNPRNIAIASELGLMFVVEGMKSQVIAVFEMDGNWLNNLVQVNGAVSAMAYDDNHLYFSDSLRGTIERIAVGGENRTVLQQQLKTPIAMDLSSDSIFWLDAHSSRINWSNKQNLSAKHEFYISNSPKNSDKYQMMTLVNNLKLSRNNNTSACSLNNSNCNYKLDSSCSEDNFRCDSGHCIPMDSVCDDVPDCPDGTDEGDNCDTLCEDKLCEHNCVPGPKGPICYCETGYRSAKNGQQCDDIDECLSENKCSQYCTNTEGHYDCSCAPGYYLEQDKHTCKVIDGRPLMIAASAHRVAILRDNNATASHRGLASHDAPIKGIAYHKKHSTLFWITSAGVSRLGNVGQALVYKMEGLIPSGLALDSITGNIYVSALIVDQDRSIIKVVSNSLDADVDVVNSQTKITDIIIDGVRGVLFWSEHFKSSSGRIVRSSMNGKFTREIHYTGVTYPVALALDPVKSRIYWADKAQSISSCDYDGQHPRELVVARTNGQPLSLTFFENRISWTVLNQNVIYSQLVTGEPVINSFKLFEGVQHLFTSHSILEPEYPNPCTSSSCGNGLCVLKNSSSFSCFCPTNTNVISVQPFKCSNRCPSHSFYCQPDLQCLPLSLVCSGNQDCDDLTDLELCKRVNKTMISDEFFSMDSLARRTLHSLFSFPSILSNATNRWITDAAKKDDHRISFHSSSGSRVVYSRHVEIRDEVYINDGHISNEDPSHQIELALQAVLDGPVYVLSRLFTRKGHHIDYVTIFNQENKPVFINPVWDVKNHTTPRFVEDIEVSYGGRMILWKVFRPQAYAVDNNLNLRTVHQMELRTLEKMGFLLQVVNLANWNKLKEKERITFIQDAITLALKP